MQSILDDICKKYKLDANQVITGKRKPELVKARMLAGYRMYNAGYGSAVIAKFLQTNHTSVLQWVSQLAFEFKRDKRASDRFPYEGQRVYVCGKITGEEPISCKNKFDYIGRKLAGLGYVPVLPTDIVPAGTEWHTAMKICIGELTRCKFIFPLEDSYHSRGATIELQLAKIAGIPLLNIAEGT